MEVTVLGVLLALAVLATIILGWQAWAARSSINAAQSELENVRQRLGAAEAQAKKNGEFLEKKRKEAEELKAQLKDNKKRRHEEREAARFKKDLREAREQITIEMEKKIERSREDAEIARAQLRKLALELEDLKKRPPTQVVVDNKPAKPAKNEEPPREPRIKPEEVARAEKAEKALSQSRQKIQELEGYMKKARGRAETDRRVFLVQKGEIDLAKDRFRSLEARFNAVALERDELKKELWLLRKKQDSVTGQPTPNKEIHDQAVSSFVANQKSCLPQPS